MRMLGDIPDLRRNPDADDGDEVSRAELFFDLVFVFTVTQLSRALEAELTAIGAAEVLIMLLAMWWSWTYTTWTTNWLNPDTAAVRTMLFSLMFLGLLMSTSITSAFADLPIVFVVGYLGMQLGRSAFIVVALRRHNRQLSDHAIRNGVWFLISTPLWIAGVVADEQWRLGFWSAAIAIDYLAPLIRYRLPILGASPTEAGAVSGAHMSERSGLFIILALGESIVTTGTGFSDGAFDVASVAAFSGALVGAILLWLIYFAHGADQGLTYIEESDETSSVARRSYTYLHVILVAGIVLVAVGDSLVLAEPDARVDLPIALTVVGGAALYLVGNLLFKHSVGVPWLKSHLVGIAACAVVLVVAVVSDIIDPLVLTWSVNAILAGVAIGAERTYRRANTVDR